MAALDEQEAEARDRQPAPELSAAEVVAYLRDQPRLWDDASPRMVRDRRERTSGRATASEGVPVTEPMPAVS